MTMCVNLEHFVFDIYNNPLPLQSSRFLHRLRQSLDSLFSNSDPKMKRLPILWRATSVLALVVLHSCTFTEAFQQRGCQHSVSIRQTTPSSYHLGMISFGLGGGTSTSEESLPRDVKDAVSRCRAATQEALKNRVSRMDIEFPVGTKFGVEQTPKVKLAKEKGPTKDQLDQSDRELARLFVEMFQPVGGENICVTFTTQDLADSAKSKWKGDSGASSRILAMNRRKNSTPKKKASKPKGFAAKIAAEIEDDSLTGGGAFELPKNAEVALFVAPGPKELVVIDKICQEVGMGTLVILLNARLAKVENFGTAAAEQLFRKDFEPVFCLSAASQDAAPDCLMYRAYPGKWQLARKPAVGQPKTILTQNTKPTNVECKTAYEGIVIGDLEKGVETALENVVGWFR